MKHYLEGATPDDAYETWKREWKPPQRVPLALGGRCIVEFAPFGWSGPLWVPEEAGLHAILIDDSTGEIKPGTEVVVIGEEGTHFEWEERRFCVVRKNCIELEVLA